MSTNLILTLVGLLFLFIVLVSVYVVRMRQAPKKGVASETIETFESLCAILQNRSTPAAELHRASEVLTLRYGTITGETVGVYLRLIEALCTHPHTDSKVILRFEKALRTANPRFAEQIEHALAHGLAKRG